MDPNVEGGVLAGAFVACVSSTLVLFACLWRMFPSCGCGCCEIPDDWCCCVAWQWCTRRWCCCVRWDLSRVLLQDMERLEREEREEAMRVVESDMEQLRTELKQADTPDTRAGVLMRLADAEARASRCWKELDPADRARWRERPPPDPAVFQAREEQMRRARDAHRAALAKLRECQAAFQQEHTPITVDAHADARLQMQRTERMTRYWLQQLPEAEREVWELTVEWQGGKNVV